MQITTYQMHNVLNCFCRRLSKNREPEAIDAGSVRAIPHHGGLGPEISHEAAMNKISEQVLQTIAQAGESSGGALPGSNAANEAGVDPPGNPAPPAESSFTFNVIDAVNRKQTATLAAGDAGALIKCLGQLAGNRGSRIRESWG